MAFEDPFDVQDPTTGEDILAAFGDILRQDALAAISPPRVRAHRNTVQSIPSDELTKVEFQSAIVNSHAMWDDDDATRRCKLIQPVDWAADMLLGAHVRWENRAPGAGPGDGGGTRRYAEIQVNEAVKVDDHEGSISATGFAANSISTLWFPAVDDYFTLHVYHDCATNLNIEVDGYAGTVFWAAFAGLHGVGAG